MVRPFGNEITESNQYNMITPTAPPLLSSNLDFIDFILMSGDGNICVRCDRLAVLRSSAVLERLINSCAHSRNGKFSIPNVNQENFELMVRYFETKAIKFINHVHILDILDLATQFDCPDLIVLCARELDQMLTHVNVVDVFRTIRCHISGQTDQYLQTLIDKPVGKNTMHPLFTPEEYLQIVYVNCLQFIDLNAEVVFKSSSEMLNDLKFEELEKIVTRSTLQITLEVHLIEVLSNWSRCECRRKCLDDKNAENRRRVLGGLCYTPRFLIMSSDEFKQSCHIIELLDQEEYNLVVKIMNGEKNLNLSLAQETMINKFRNKREVFPRMPVHISSRSHPKKFSKKMRKHEKRITQQLLGVKPGCCEIILLKVAVCFACLCD